MITEIFESKHFILILNYLDINFDFYILEYSLKNFCKI
jgi:hypothetical protein